MIADQFLESGLWTMLWTRVSQSLKSELNSDSPDTDSADPMSTRPATSTSPASHQQQTSPIDWRFISPSGYLSLLQLASRMLTISTQNCAALVLRDDSLMFDTLSCMLSERFLTSVKKR